MMIDPRDRRIAELCRLDYDPLATPTWETPGRCRAFLHRDPGFNPTVIFEGTRPDKIADWLRDFDAEAVRYDPLLDLMHAGFAGDVLSVIFRIQRDLAGETVDFGGHSKGGSEAEDAAAIWLLSGGKLGRVTALEPARTGNLGGLIKDAPGISTHLSSGMISDPVPAEPPWLSHPRAITPLLAATPLFIPTDCHLIVNVEAAMDAAMAA